MNIMRLADQARRVHNFEVDVSCTPWKDITYGTLGIVNIGCIGASVGQVIIIDENAVDKFRYNPTDHSWSPYYEQQ